MNSKATIQQIRRKGASVSAVLRFEELPEWMQVDPLIQRGYRHELKSISRCFVSLLHLHNETVNIWSHLLPAMLHMAVLSSQIQSIESSDPCSIDRQVVNMYIVTVVLCLLISVGTYFPISLLQMLIRDRLFIICSARIRRGLRIKF